MSTRKWKTARREGDGKNTEKQNVDRHTQAEKDKVINWQSIARMKWKMKSRENRAEREGDFNFEAEKYIFVKY